MPSNPRLQVAREEFRYLLEQPTSESQWQAFFAKHPYVLSGSLPLRLGPGDIIPLGRPGRTEPDFVFYPQAVRPVPYYGVIELKRPDTRILSVPRAGTAILTRDAETAIQQVESYAQLARRYLPHESGRSLFLGSELHGFIIMGLSTELLLKLGAAIRSHLVERRLPPNLSIIPYDTLLSWFELGIPHIHFLAPGITRKGSDKAERLERLRGEWERLVSAGWGAAVHGGYPVTRRAAVGLMGLSLPLRYRKRLHKLDARLSNSASEFSAEEIEELELMLASYGREEEDY